MHDRCFTAERDANFKAHRDFDGRVAVARDDASSALGKPGKGSGAGARHAIAGKKADEDGRRD